MSEGNQMEFYNPLYCKHQIQRWTRLDDTLWCAVGLVNGFTIEIGFFTLKLQTQSPRKLQCLQADLERLIHTGTLLSVGAKRHGEQGKMPTEKRREEVNLIFFH